MPQRNGPKCGAKLRRRDGTCTLPAGWHTDHPGYGRCSWHGGSAPNGKKAAETQRAEAEARSLLAGIGEFAEVTDPVAELQRLAGRAVRWLEVLESIVTDLHRIRYTTQAEQIDGRIVVFERARWLRCRGPSDRARSTRSACRPRPPRGSYPPSPTGTAGSPAAATSPRTPPQTSRTSAPIAATACSGSLARAASIRLVLPAPVAGRIDAYLASRSCLTAAPPSRGRSGAPRPRRVLFATDTGARLLPTHVWRLVRRVGKEAALPAELVASLGPHAMRHSFATLYLDSGGSLRDLQDAMGHADPRTTCRYYRARYSLDCSPG